MDISFGSTLEIPLITWHNGFINHSVYIRYFVGFNHNAAVSMIGVVR